MRVAFVLGLLLAALAAWSWRIPAQEGELGLDVRVVAASSGEFAVDPSGPFAAGRALGPGRGRAAGSTRVRNQTARPMVVAARLLPESPALDEIVRVRLSLGGRPLHDGTLAAARQWSRLRAVVPPGATRELAAELSIPASVRTGYEGRIEDLALELRARVAEGPR